MNYDRDPDVDQIKLLSIFHFVVAGLLALLAMVPLIHLSIGVAIVSGALKGARGEVAPVWIGWILIAMASLAILVGLSVAGCTAAAGYRLRSFRSYTFCLVVAGVLCIFFPLGTALGVFTIIVLVRPSVKAKFGSVAAATTP